LFSLVQLQPQLQNFRRGAINAATVLIKIAYNIRPLGSGRVRDSDPAA
jgi:hypothetical protein